MLQIFKSVSARRSWRLVGVFCTSIVLAVSIACVPGGSDIFIDPDSLPVLLHSGDATVPAGVQVSVPLTTIEAGNLRVRIYISDKENTRGNLEVAVGRGTDPCTLEQVASDTCQTLLDWTTAATLPGGTALLDVFWHGSAAGAYILYIANSGIAEETYQYRFYLNR